MTQPMKKTTLVWTVNGISHELRIYGTDKTLDMIVKQRRQEVMDKYGLEEKDIVERFGLF